jgi:hypothetical protein
LRMSDCGLQISLACCTASRDCGVWIKNLYKLIVLDFRTRVTLKIPLWLLIFHFDFISIVTFLKSILDISLLTSYIAHRTSHIAHRTLHIIHHTSFKPIHSPPQTRHSPLFGCLQVDSWWISLNILKTETLIDVKTMETF